MTESSSSLRLRAQADVAGLKEWARAIREAADEMERLKSLSGDSGGGGSAGTGGGGTATGSPPTAPAPPSPTGNAEAETRRKDADARRAEAQAALAEVRANRAQQQQSQAPGFMGRASSTAMGVIMGGIGLSLGSSLEGFLLQSGQHFMETSKVITQLGMRFREAGRDAAFFGGQLGFTVAQSAALAQALGAQTNRFDKGQALQYAGFARHTGVDAGLAMGTLGRLSMLQGGAFGVGQAAALAGRAGATGMGQGRMEEFLQTFSGLAEMQAGATGGLNFGAVMGAQGIAGQVFGGGFMGRGQAGLDFTQRLQGVFTQRGSPLQTFLMRAMGFGRAGGPDYISMRERLDAGIFDRRNVLDVFGMMQSQGMGRGSMFKALESVSGGALNAKQLASLVDTLGTQSGLSQYRKATEDGSTEADKQSFLQGLDADQRDTFQKFGFGGEAVSAAGKRLTGGLGAQGVSMGEAQAVKMEAVQLAIGGPVAQAIIDGRDVLQNLFDALQKMAGLDIGGIVKSVGDLAVKGSKWVDDHSSDQHGNMAKGVGLVGDAVADPMGMAHHWAAGDITVAGVPSDQINASAQALLVRHMPLLGAAGGFQNNTFDLGARK